jgi:hypothetical protein
MMNLTLTISNPFSNQEWENVKTYNGLVKKTKHMAWEFNIYRTSILAGFDFSWTRKCDHAGLDLFLGLFGYTVEFHVYDTRHWDYVMERYGMGE